MRPTLVKEGEGGTDDPGGAEVLGVKEKGEGGRAAVPKAPATVGFQWQTLGRGEGGRLSLAR